MKDSKTKLMTRRIQQIVCRGALIGTMVICTTGVAFGNPGALVDDARRSLETISPPLGAHRVEIEYRGQGKIELKGDVASQEDKQRIVDRVEGVRGVKQVDDSNLVVAALGKPEGVPKGSEGEVARVRAAIRDCPTRGAYSVAVVPQVLATGREILRLQGEAETARTRDDIVKAARGATALAVVDEMTLQKPRPDSDIQSDIQRTLQEEYPKVAARVNVSVQDGVVRLRGDLSNHRDIDKVLASTNMVKGVQDIVSEITIHGRPYTQKHEELPPHK